MSDREITVVEDILATCEGVVAWGGEMRPVKQSHFQIDVRPHDPRLQRLVAKINGWERSRSAARGSSTPSRRIVWRAHGRHGSARGA